MFVKTDELLETVVFISLNIKFYISCMGCITVFNFSTLSLTKFSTFFIIIIIIIIIIYLFIYLMVQGAPIFLTCL
jgi:hypothetical protein